MNETEIESFFGVYLLYCTNEKYKGRTYIGYTVNPKRRIKQHNAGKKFGGAWRTSNRGPWNMILIIHGFPSSTAALRFEWAWQHPQLSRRLKHVPKKRSSQRVLDFQLTVLSAMLKVGPWNRLPLTVRWLDDDFGQRYCNDINAPLHMPIVYGKVTTKKLPNNKGKDKRADQEKSSGESESTESEVPCSICGMLSKPEERLSCVNPRCTMLAHLPCLAEVFTNDGSILPVEGCCPSCDTSVLWGDLIRKKIGCNLHLPTDSEPESDDD